MFWSLVLSFRVRLDWSYAQAQETEVLVQMLSRFPSSIDPNKIPCHPCLSLCVGGVGFRVLPTEPNEVALAAPGGVGFFK